MKRIKIAVVGNCQARPIANLLTNLNPNIEITSVSIVHLVKENEKEKYWTEFNNADFIIGQQVNENYPLKFVQSENLKATFKEKYLEIVNLYYRGYNPEVQYLRDPNLGTIKGPMGDYHHTIILNSWKEGKSADLTAKLVEDESVYQELFNNIHVTSLNELKRRENNLRVKITDFIAENLALHRLFFTINHPSLLLLNKYVMLQMAALEIPILNRPIIEKEPLDKFIFPISSFTQKTLNIQFKSKCNFKGISFTINNNSISPIKSNNYDLNSIVNSYFEVYNFYLNKNV